MNTNFLFKGKGIRCERRIKRWGAHTTLGGGHMPASYQARLYLVDRKGSILRLLGISSHWVEEDEVKNLPPFEELWEDYPFKWFVDGIVTQKNEIPEEFNGLQVTPYEVRNRIGDFVTVEMAKKFYGWLSDVTFKKRDSYVLSFEMEHPLEKGKLAYVDIGKFDKGKYVLYDSFHLS